MKGTAEIETPAVLIDRLKLEANLLSMQELADKHGLALRPHAKTHKSVQIGRRQIALGACGLTVATVDEALVFGAHGITSITISRPIVSSEKIDRVLAGLAPGIDLRVVVDSESGVAAAAGPAADSQRTLGVFIKVDVGLGRCGVDPGGSGALELARLINESAHLEFRGILSHAGQAYAADSREAAAEIAAAERLTMLGVRDALIGGGVEVPEVSVGATPTVLAAANFEGITEIRPGNYVFLDLLPIGVGVATEDQVALTVLATIISKNSRYFVTDAGSKSLTSDSGVHGMTGTKGFGAAYPEDRYLSPDHRLRVDGLSEEHGKLARTDFDLAIGSRVRIIPNHSCPVANLAQQLVIVQGGTITQWPIDAARGSR
jgi:D-serine deaminase-like pyridoxal phosphate-dependent protein